MEKKKKIVNGEEIKVRAFLGGIKAKKIPWQNKLILTFSAPISEIWNSSQAVWEWMPASLKLLHFQKRINCSIHKSGFGKEKGNIFRAYFLIEGKRILLLGRKTSWISDCTCFSSQTFLSSRKTFFWYTCPGGVKPVSIYGKNLASGFKDALPFADSTGGFRESRAGICSQPDQRNSLQKADFPHLHGTNQFLDPCYLRYALLSRAYLQTGLCLLPHDPSRKKGERGKPVPVPTSSTFKRLLEAREFSKICFQTVRSSSSKPFTPFV